MWKQLFNENEPAYTGNGFVFGRFWVAVLRPAWQVLQGNKVRLVKVRLVKVR
jgi:hypothetical protein